MSEKWATHSPKREDLALLEGEGVNSQLHFPPPPLSLSPFPQVSSDAITDFVFVIAVVVSAEGGGAAVQLRSRRPCRSVGGRGKCLDSQSAVIGPCDSFGERRKEGRMEPT